MQHLRKLSRLLVLLTLCSCVKNDGFDQIEEKCDLNLVSTKTIEEIYNIAGDSVKKYRDDDIIEGFVVSNDQSGNFFKTLAIQARNGSSGFSISIDHTDLYTKYNPGRKVYIQLKGLYTEIDNNALKIGDLFIDRFSNETVGRIAYPGFEEVLMNSCEVIDENQLVSTLTLDAISDTNLNTLVEFKDVQFITESIRSTFYDVENDEGGSASNLVLEDTSGNELIFRTSAFADFALLDVPAGSGTIRGILTKFKGTYQLLIRSLSDLDLTKERFEVVLRNNIFFSELADPNNNSGARFIEIYNAENEAINLNGWTIRRYTNANSSISSTLDLSGSVIESKQAFVIAANAAEFESVFGFAPDLAAGTNGPADSNGDDNLELVDSEGIVVDIFGVIGEDGSGTSHEFEDGRALRAAHVVIGNPIFSFGEWQIWNDTGGGGTIKAPQDAPGNFTPGER